MALAPQAIELSNAHVVLRPSSPADAAELFAALDDAVVWRWLKDGRPAEVAEVERRLVAAERLRERGERFQWTVRLATPEAPVVGMTSYGDIHPGLGKIEIGWTAYGVRWQRTAANTATKLLLLGHAFDELGYERVALKTDALNERSQAAIARLGAAREGTLRSDQLRSDGSRRDTVYFSILRPEWTAVRERLVARLV